MKKKFLYVLILAALVVSGYLVYHRYEVEKTNRIVALAVDLSDLKLLARRNGVPLQYLLRKVKSTGINVVGVSMDTVGSLVQDGKIALFSGREFAFFGDGRVSVPPYYSCIVIPDKDSALIKRLKFNLSAVWKEPEMKVFRYRKYVVIAVPSDKEDILTFPAGFSSADIDIVRGVGYEIVLRPINRQNASASWYKSVLDFVANSNVSRVVVFGGVEVLGYPVHIKDVAKLMKSKHLYFGEVEFSNQLGEKALAMYMMPDVLRVHSISSDEMLDMTVPRAVARYLRAVKERDMRILYIRPFLVPDPAPISMNMEYFKRVAHAIRHAGFTIGMPKPLPVWWNMPYFILVILLGVAAGMTLAYELFFPLSDRYRWIYLLLFALIQVNFFFQKGFVFAEQFSALLAAVVFPFLSVAVISRDVDNAKALSVKMVVVSLLKVVVVSLIGGIFIAAMLGQTAFMLKVFEFRGVKVAYVFPLLGILLYYYIRKDGWSGIRDFWDRPLYVQEFVGLLLLVGALGIYVLRSGNFSVVPVTHGEEHLRDVLENLLWARPRFKEIAVGYPALAVLFILSSIGYKRYEPWFAMITGIASISVVNTFCHIHTPIAYSVIRTLNGVWVGVVEVVVIVLVYKGINGIIQIMKLPMGKPTYKSKK